MEETGTFENLELRKRTPHYDDFYEDNLKSKEVDSKLEDLKLKIESKLDSDKNMFGYLGDLETILMNSMRNRNQPEILHIHPHRNKNTKKRAGKSAWYNRDCMALKQTLNRVCKMVNKNPENTELRRNFYSKIRE